MSGSEPPDQDRGFLARWSQRKQEARRPDSEQDSDVRDESVSTELPAPRSEHIDEPEFDLSSLPKLEELTDTTDITAFLRKGVPEHLRNAALRKSWALDPAIRNYVSPALEYAYDWNTPGGVPGNSELSAGLDVARMVTQIMGETAAEAAESCATSGDNVASSPVPPPQRNLSAEQPAQSLHRDSEAAPEIKGLSRAEVSSDNSNATQMSEPAAPQNLVRRHGTAKPIV